MRAESFPEQSPARTTQLETPDSPVGMKNLPEQAGDLFSLGYCNSVNCEVNTQYNSYYTIDTRTLVPVLIRQFVAGCPLPSHFIFTIVNYATNLLRKEATVVSVRAPCVVVGDLHGQLYNLLYIISDIERSDNTHNYLFLGDYVDRGAHSLEVLLLLCALKIQYPARVFLICGNHESRAMNEAFTFLDELREHLGRSLTESAGRQPPHFGYCTVDSLTNHVYGAILELYQALPLAAVLDKRFFCVHGGIGPESVSVENIGLIDRFVEHMPGFVTRESSTVSVSSEHTLFRNALRPNSDRVQALLWSDPVPCQDPTIEFLPNVRRNVGYFFGFTGLCSFLHTSGLISMIRGHEVKEEGYSCGPVHPVTNFPIYFTLFSAADCNGYYPGKGAVLIITAESLHIKSFDAQLGVRPTSIDVGRNHWDPSGLFMHTQQGAIGYVENTALSQCEALVLRSETAISPHGAYSAENQHEDCEAVAVEGDHYSNADSENTEASSAGGLSGNEDESLNFTAEQIAEFEKAAHAYVDAMSCEEPRHRYSNTENAEYIGKHSTATAS